MTRAVKRTRPTRGTRMDQQPTRSYRELEVIREQYGSAFRAAMDGVINAAEFLKLERLGTH